MSRIETRGLIIFGILIVAVGLACRFAFFWLPEAGLGVPLPVITLPGEILVPFGLSLIGLDLTNTITSLILVDVVLLIMALVVFGATYEKDPATFVPRGFTHFIEIITEFLYNQAKPQLGKYTGRVFWLAASVFLFVFTANMVKMLPGFESVGIIACAETGQPGYALKGYNDGTPGTLLNVNQMDLKGRAGTKATADDLHACETKYPQFVPPAEIKKRLTGAGEHPEGDKKETAPGGEKKEGTPEPTKHAFVPSLDAVSYLAPAETGKTAAAEKGNPDLLVVIPFFRALATDLNFPFALAIVVVLAVQIWGFWALGPRYLYKFFNIPALGNFGKNPMGAIDFLVGLIEIASEISRIISLGFRLFGNIFAGGVLLIVMSFLVAFGLPVVFMFLELFVGLIQAYVFSILTIIYAGQAVVSHHAGEDHGDHHDAGHEAQAAH